MSGNTDFWRRSYDQIAKEPACTKVFSYKNARAGVYPVKSVDDQIWQQRVYRDKSAELLLYGRALGLSHSEAEDVLQETFLALLKLEREPENPVHYCVRGFRNQALNHKRGWLRRLTRELESHRWFERYEDESPAELAAMKCLQQLPPEQREVIVLKIWHEFTFEHIASLQEISPNTAAGRYRYGLQKLKQCLKEQDYEELEFAGGTTPFMAAAAPVGPR